MTASESLPLIACVGQLGLAVLALRRGDESRLSVPLALLCLGLFSWNFPTLGHRLSGSPAWRYVDVTMSPLTAPLTLNFIATFVGRKRQLSRVLTAVWAAFGSLSLMGLAAFFFDWARAFITSSAWALVFLVAAGCMLVFASVLLVQHLSRVRDPEERLRTRLVHLALILGGVLSLTELLADMGLSVPRGGSVGALVAAAVLAVLTLRFRLLEAEPSSRRVMYSVVLGALAVSAYLGVFYFLKVNDAVLLFATATVTLGSFVVLRQIFQSVAAQRERLERLAVLGRFSAQMAHDLKNPIAALKGAAQYLREELARGRTLDEQAEFVDLICGQVDRLNDVVDRYHRLGKLEAVRRRVPLNEVVSRVLSLGEFAVPPGTTLVTDLADGLPDCSVDEGLMCRAIENLVRNASEAMPAGGTIRVRTFAQKDDDSVQLVSVAVEDTGVGMDARALERVFDDFYTTKTHGTGLGLFFVKRVAEAHGGGVLIESQPGRGTVARLCIPAVM